jgi:AcrR family transcriptional regulator
MPRPRFHRLPAAQQDAILAAALEEFSEHGFAQASLNRIIAAAGISKGALYYSFDGKEDLYAHVIRDQVERLLAGGGPLPDLELQDAAAFWSTLEELYLRFMRMLRGDPRLSALLRD